MPSEPRGPSGSGSPAGTPSLGEALERIADLEARLARLESVLTLNDDGSVQLAASGQLRLVATNNVLIEAGPHFFELSIVGAEIRSEALLKLEGALMRVQASQVDVAAAIAQHSGVVRCETLVTNTVVASTYTPGAGNLM